MAENHIDFKYNSYVQDIMGPMCFDYGWSIPMGLCFKTRGFSQKDEDYFACLEEMATNSQKKFSNKCNSMD
jgi:urocanate hydratase